MKKLTSVALFSSLAFTLTALAADKKIVLIAGKPSHGPAQHEHRAGCLLIKNCLDNIPGISSVVYSNGWPNEAGAFDGADAIIIYADGGDGHPAIQKDHLQILDASMKIFPLPSRSAFLQRSVLSNNPGW